MVSISSTLSVMTLVPWAHSQRTKTTLAFNVPTLVKFALELMRQLIVLYAKQELINLVMVATRFAPMVTGVIIKISSVNVSYRPLSKFNFIACNDACKKCVGPLSSQCQKCADLY